MRRPVHSASFALGLAFLAAACGSRSPEAPSGPLYEGRDVTYWTAAAQDRASSESLRAIEALEALGAESALRSLATGGRAEIRAAAYLALVDLGHPDVVSGALADTSPDVRLAVQAAIQPYLETFRAHRLLMDIDRPEEAEYVGSRGQRVLLRVEPSEGRGRGPSTPVYRVTIRDPRAARATASETYEHDVTRHGIFPFLATAHPQDLDRVWILRRIRRATLRTAELAARCWHVECLDPALPPGEDTVDLWISEEAPAFGILRWIRNGETYDLTRTVPAWRPSPPPPVRAEKGIDFDFQNPLLSAVAGQKADLLSSDPSAGRITLEISEPGPMLRTWSGDTTPRGPSSPRSLPAYVPAALRFGSRGQAPGDPVVRPAPQRAEPITFDINYLGMPSGTNVALVELKHVVVRWGDADVLAYAAAMQRYGTMAGRVIVWLAPQGPALGILKRAQERRDHLFDEVTFLPCTED